MLHQPVRGEMCPPGTMPQRVRFSPFTYRGFLNFLSSFLEKNCFWLEGSKEGVLSTGMPQVVPRIWLLILISIGPKSLCILVFFVSHRNFCVPSLACSPCFRRGKVTCRCKEGKVGNGRKCPGETPRIYKVSLMTDRYGLVVYHTHQYFVAFGSSGV